MAETIRLLTEEETTSQQRTAYERITWLERQTEEARREIGRLQAHTFARKVIADIQAFVISGAFTRGTGAICVVDEWYNIYTSGTDTTLARKLIVQYCESNNLTTKEQSNGRELWVKIAPAKQPKEA